MIDPAPVLSNELPQMEEPSAATVSSIPAVESAAAGESAVDQPATLAQATQTALLSVLARLEQQEQTLAHLATAVDQLAERIDLLPRQIRQLGSKVDSIIESVSEPRLRDLLMSLLLLYDLAEQMGRAAETDPAAGHNYRVLRDQIAQALRVNGIEPIAEARRFDPALHKAVETLPCAAPEEDGDILRVCRAGFRTERAILRYAEVAVKRYQQPA